MIFYVNGQEVEIDTSIKPFAQGSEGKLYLIDNTLYKIYYDNSLNDGFGKKKNDHIRLTDIKTERFVMPEYPIFTDEGYVGYTTPLITTRKNAGTGIIYLDEYSFIGNVSSIINDINLLSSRHVKLSDVSPMNFILHNDLMYIIDPGRYSFDDSRTYLEPNMKQFEALIKTLILRDLRLNKEIDDKKIELIKRELNFEIARMGIGNYFDEVFSKTFNIEEYVRKRK